MGAPPKPGVDWNEIHRLFTQHPELSLTRIAKLHDITRPAIAKRAKKHGWKRPEGAPKSPTKRTKEIALAGLAISCIDPTSEVADLIIERVKDCTPIHIAAGAEGISMPDLTAWLDSDPDIAARIDMARHEAIATLIRRVREASDRGDVKASQWLLERVKETREEFAPTRQQASDVGGITVILNIPRPIPLEPVVVDVSAVEVG